MKNGKFFVSSISEYTHTLINSSDFVGKFKSKKSFFSRPSRCKLTFQMLFVFILDGIKRSIQLEMIDFIKKVNPMCTSYSKQAFSKRRNCIKWEAFQALFLGATNFFYEKADYLTFHDYVTIAIDGSKLNLTDSEELNRVFGEQISSGAPQNQALASCAYDVMNGMYLDAILAPCKSNERELAVQHIDNIRQNYQFEKILYIFDRGYPSTALIQKLVDSGNSYLFRCDKTFISKAELTGNDCTVDYRFLKADKHIQIRIVRMKLKDGREEILVTNLPESEISYEEIIQLYHKRWGIESSYDTLKNVIELENFSGISETAIRQDFFASLYLYNLSSVSIFDNKEAFDKAHNKKTNKWKYKQNRALTIGELRPAVIDMLATNSRLKSDLLLAKIYRKMTKFSTQIKPDRSFVRVKNHKSIKFPQNCRRSI